MKITPMASEFVGIVASVVKTSRGYMTYIGGCASKSHIVKLDIVCCSCAKYRAIPFSLIIRSLFPSFLHHHYLQILYATNFLIENVFYLLVKWCDMKC